MVGVASARLPESDLIFTEFDRVRFGFAFFQKLMNPLRITADNERVPGVRLRPLGRHWLSLSIAVGDFCVWDSAGSRHRQLDALNGLAQTTFRDRRRRDPA
jgi:hypothetical protein